MMFFRKPKGWAELSKEDQDWAKTLKKGNSAPQLEACARNNEVSRIRYIFDNLDTYQLTGQHVQAAVLKAVQNRSTETLKYIHDHTLWDAVYTQTVIIEAIRNKSAEALKFIYEGVGKKKPVFYDTWKQSFGVFTAASETGSTKECWDVVAAGNDALPPRLRISIDAIAEIAVNHDFPEAYNDVLGKKANPDDAGVFDTAMKAAAKKSPATMCNVLRWKDRFPGAQKVLDDLLCEIAAEGKKAETEILLGAGANVNHGKGRAFKAAVNNGKLEVVEFLVSKGADVLAYGPSLIPALLNGSGSQWEVGRYLDGFFDGRYLKIREKADENKNFALADKDTLAEKKQLPFGGTLTILFNFALRQQTVIAQDTTAKKEAMALQVINFCDIENEALDRVAKKFIELGGDPKMTEELKIRRPGLTRD